MHVCVKAFYRGLNHQAPFRVFNGDTSGRFNEGLRKKNPEKGQFLHRERERERERERNAAIYCYIVGES